VEYRNLGRTGVKVSELCLGTMMFGRHATEHDSVAMVEHALEHGINFIDTANAYSAGASERFVGKALNARAWSSRPKRFSRRTRRTRTRAG